jgi:hypothetical protein
MSTGRAADIPRTPFTFATIQFFIPSTVAERLDDPLIRDRVEAAGFERRAWEWSTHRMPPGKTLITCKRYVAAFLVEHIAEIANTATGRLLVDCSDAVQSALDGIAGKPQKR